jgi:hypothetical protein
MEILIDIEDELSPLLARLICEVVGKVPKQLVAHDKCSNPTLGKWIDNCDVPLLMETLALGDAIFKEEFPEIPLTAEQRKVVANTLEAQCERCEHCQAKRAEDLAWRSWVVQAIARDKSVVRKVLARAAGRK